MKKPYALLTLLFGIGGVILFQSYSSGPAASGFGATGAPGESANTCITCHSGGSFATALTLEVKDGANVIAEYTPGQTYTLEVTVAETSGMPSGYGFQIVALDDAGDGNVGGWANPSANAKLSSNGGRDYVEHNATSSSGTFSVDWTAPTTGTGSVTIYGAGNAVNGNAGQGGDSPVFGDLTLSEAQDSTQTSVAELSSSTFSVYPNPATDFITINAESQRGNIEIMDVQGRVIRTEAVGANTSVNVSDLQSGIYFLRLEGEKDIQRFLKH